MAIKFKIRHFKFSYALCVSVLLHLFLLLFIIANFNFSDKQDKVKYVKVKIGQMHQKPQVKKHNKSKKEERKKQVTNQKAQKKQAKRPKSLKRIVHKKINPVKKPTLKKHVVKKSVKPASKPKLEKEQLIEKVKNNGKGDKEKAKSKAVKGAKLGNRKYASQEVIDGYRQLIVLWLEKHQVYPEEAKRSKLTGTAKMRLVLRKDGKLLDYKLLEKTGFPILDKAITVMVENSDPFPKFPNEYPDIEIDEFEIKANIVLKKQVSSSIVKGLFP